MSDESVLGYEVYRVVLDYDALHEAFVDRVEDLGAPRSEINVAGKFTPGYAAKLLCNPPMKILGKESLGKMLRATGMALVVVIDDDRFAPIKAKMGKRKRALPANARMARPAWLFTKDCAREMGIKRWEGVPEKKRSRIARKAAKARWAAKRRADKSAQIVCPISASPSVAIA